MSDEEDELSRVVADIPTPLKQEAKEKLPHGGLTEVIERAIAEEVNMTEMNKRDRLIKRRDTIDRQIDKKTRQRRELDAGIEELKDERQRVQAELDRLDTDEERFTGQLEIIEENLYGGMHIDPDHPNVKRAARTIDGMDADDVIAALKDRNPNIATNAPHAFKQKLNVRKTWDGCSEDWARQSPDDEDGDER